LTARNNILIAGPAGSGKTTLLRSLLNQFSHERVITIEDAAELGLSSQNAVSLLSRVANVEGQGEIGLDRLLIEALRMSPDRIAVGEVRGSELVTMLDALNTGHSGAGATIHANSLVAVASRLLTIGARAGLSPEAISMQVIDAFSLVDFVARDHRIESIGRFSLRDGRLVVQPID
jgi:pilus assembly protein CpaF